MKILAGRNYKYNIYIVTEDSFSEIPVGHCVANPSIVLHEGYIFEEARVFMQPIGEGYHRVLEGFYFAVHRNLMAYSESSILYYKAGKFRF